MTGSKNINDVSLGYSEAAAVANEAGLDMLSRLSLIKVNPITILDIGCGPGLLSHQLKKTYPAAHIIAVDHAERKMPDDKAGLSWCCADGKALPFPDHSIDFIFANFFLPWTREIKIILKEWRRVLVNEGLLMVTALGPDTLCENIKDDLVQHLIPHRCDMHDLGDALLSGGFLDPVLDVSYYTTTHTSLEQKIKELKASEMIPAALFSDGPPFHLEANLETTYEVIFAHAFAPLAATQAKGVVKVPLTQLREQLVERKRKAGEE